MISLILYSMLAYVFSGLLLYAYIILKNWELFGGFIYRCEDKRIGAIYVGGLPYIFIWWIFKIYEAI